MYKERFKDILLNMRDDVSCSLPMCNLNSELLFFYYTKPDENKYYHLEKIIGVFSRDIQTGKIVELPPPNEMRLQQFKPTFNTSPPPLDALKYRKEYETLYESYYQSKLSGLVVAPSQCQKLQSIFDSLVQDLSLRHVYLSLGADYFASLSNTI